MITLEKTFEVKDNNFKYSTKWCVITGTVSSGKTSVINELAKRGFPTQIETARSVIEGYLNTGKTLQDVRDNQLELQTKIMDAIAERENNLDNDKFIFLDRGMPDNIGYFKFSNLDDTEVTSKSYIYKYDKIFFFERLPLEEDGLRREDEEIAKEMERLHIEDYKAIGYNLIHVPVMPIQDRVEFILDNI